MNRLLAVDTVGSHDPPQIKLEHFGHLNRKRLDAQCSFLCCCLLALLLGFRRQLLFFGHGPPLQFRWPAAPAKSDVTLAALALIRLMLLSVDSRHPQHRRCEQPALRPVTPR